jgi:hypothetical protein
LSGGLRLHLNLTILGFQIVRWDLFITLKLGLLVCCNLIKMLVNVCPDWIIFLVNFEISWSWDNYLSFLIFLSLHGCALELECIGTCHVLRFDWFLWPQMLSAWLSCRATKRVYSCGCCDLTWWEINWLLFWYFKPLSALCKLSLTSSVIWKTFCVFTFNE